MAVSTNAMLLLDQRTLQIKYRIPATEVYRLSLSPFHDNIAVFHVKDVRIYSFHAFFHDLLIIVSILLYLVGTGTKKGWLCFPNGTCNRSDYKTIFGHPKCYWTTAGNMHRLRVIFLEWTWNMCVLILIFLSHRFDVMFSNQTVTLSFKLSSGLNDAHAALNSPQLKITRKSDRMEIIIWFALLVSKP